MMDTNVHKKPESQHKKVGWGTVKADFLASIVVFLVALPLCMGIAIASGAPVASGLITGIVGGLIVGVLAGCPLQVSGPAAGLTVIVFDLVQRFGLEMLGLAVLMGGAIQLAAGGLRLGQWFRAVSPAVIKGMLAGIGVLIFASQFHVMVDDKPRDGGLQNLVTIPESVAKGLAMPVFGTPAEREFRTDALRKIGELHRRQVALEEKIAEVLPDHASADELQAESPETVASEAAALVKLVDEQAEITSQLSGAVDRLEQHAKSAAAPKTEKNGQIARQALAASQATLADLRAGRVRDVLTSQDAAIAGLESLLGGMKNHNFAAYLGLITIILILIWQGAIPKKWRVVPGPLVAIVIATAAATLLSLPVLYVEVPDNLLDEVRVPQMSVLQDAPWGALIQAAIVIAVVASAETLLCATAVDQLHDGKRTNYDRELMAQGVGNITCGLLGALPMTGVIVRSSANVQAGGQTRLSAFLHGVWLLVFVAILSSLLRMIPTASLAGILVYTGYKLMHPRQIFELAKYGKGEVFVFLVTVSFIVATDLLTGVIVGIAFSAGKLLLTFSRLKTHLDLQDDNQRAHLQIEGAATFIRLPKLARELERIPRGADVHIDLQLLNYIDHACFELLLNWTRQHESNGGSLVLDWDTLHARFKSSNPARREAVREKTAQRNKQETSAALNSVQS